MNDKTQVNIYCDESRHTSGEDKYMVIGAIKCNRELKSKLVHQIHSMKKKYNTQGEFGWKRLSPNKKEFYFELINLFINTQLSFRCIVVDKDKLNYDLYHGGDKELGFYKFYYLMLKEILESNSEYHIYLDWQQNSDQHRFKDLKFFLEKKLQGKAKISCLEPVTSTNQPLIELVDLFIGAVGYQYNDRNSSKVKLEFCNKLAIELNKLNLSSFKMGNLKTFTAKDENKFNIFKWEPNSYE